MEVSRSAHSTRDPVRIAERLVDHLAGWIPATSWGVVVTDTAGQLAVLEDRTLTATLGSSGDRVAQWILAHGEEFLSADLEIDHRIAQGKQGTIVGFPLITRGQTVGAVIAADAMPSASVPRLTVPVLVALRVLLEVPAAALDQALLLQRAEALSVTDDLTHLYNSRFLDQSLRREAKRMLRSGRPLSLLFIDLDGFKSINDAHGHFSGSRALVEAAAVIRGCARETDVVARFGGDEFAIVLPETTREGAVAVADRVRERIAAYLFLAADGFNIQLTASVGVSTLPDAASTWEDLLKTADAAMYRVKNAGKNGIHVATMPADPR